MKTTKNTRNLHFRYYVETREKACAVEAGKKNTRNANDFASPNKGSAARAKNTWKRRAKWKARKQQRAEHWKLPSENALRGNQRKGAARATCDFLPPLQNWQHAKNREFHSGNVRGQKPTLLHRVPASPPEMRRNCLGPSAVRKNALRKVCKRK